MQAQAQKMVPNFTEHSDLPWLLPWYPHPGQQSAGLCLAQHLIAKKGSSSLLLSVWEILSVAELIISHFTGTRLFFIYQWYESLHIKLKLFWGKIGTVSKLNFELPNHYIRLALEGVQSMDPGWTGSPWTLRDWHFTSFSHTRLGRNGLLVQQVQVLKNISSGIIVETYWVKRPANCYHCHSYVRSAFGCLCEWN